MKREEGFTLVELLATMALVAILLTLGVSALRYFWLGQALYDKRDEVYTNMRSVQQQVVSESNPTVVGAWFRTGDTEDQPEWGTVRLVPETDPVTGITTLTCTRVSDHHLDSGVEVLSATFADSLSGIDSVDEMAEACRSQVEASAAATDFVFFLARGTATSGCVTLTQLFRDMDDVTVAVSTLTGRVERVEPEEVATRCPA